MAAANQADEATKERLKTVFRRLDVGSWPRVNRLTLGNVLCGVGIPADTAEKALNAAEKDGQIDIDLFLDWVFAPHDARQELIPTDGGAKVKDGPVFVGTLNFLGNAYNAMEFINPEEAFMNGYTAIRKCFGELTCKEVLNEALELGFDREKLAPLVPESSDKFESRCSKDFLRRDNKHVQRTNMVVAGMMPTVKGPPQFTYVSEWRDVMRKAQGMDEDGTGAEAMYDMNIDAELVLWDIACNLAAERNADAYGAMCDASYLNPQESWRNVQTLLSRIPRTGQEVVLAVQEFPEKGTPKWYALISALPALSLKYVTPEVDNASVGFILSTATLIQEKVQSPLGQEPAQVYAEIRKRVPEAGLPEWDKVEKSDVESLKTTAFKTFVLDVAKSDLRGAMRFISVHAKEFKTDEGCRLLATYLRAMAADPKEVASFILLDTNTPSAQKSLCFHKALESVGFQVLSNAEANYVTTRKKRSEMHGQIYDRKKCLQVVEAHKTFAAMLTDSAGPPVWEPIWKSCASFGDKKVAALPFPDLKADDKILLPSSTWPTDHCMLQVEVKYNGLNKA